MNFTFIVKILHFNKFLVVSNVTKICNKKHEAKVAY